MLENKAENRAIPSRAKAIAKPEGRSRVFNGKDLFLEGVDALGVGTPLLSQLTSDIGGDPSEAQSIIIRRATQLAVWCEQAEAEAAGGKPLNIGEYATATNTLRRLLLDLGLERRMRDITPSIDAYLKR